MLTRTHGGRTGRPDVAGDQTSQGLDSPYGKSRDLENDRIITLRTGDLSEVVPGNIITIKPNKDAGHAFSNVLSGSLLQKYI